MSASGRGEIPKELEAALAAYDAEVIRSRSLETEILRLRSALAPFAMCFDAMRDEVRNNLGRDLVPSDVHADPRNPARLMVHHLRAAREALTREPSK